jgi:hypothetical protein
MTIRTRQPAPVESQDDTAFPAGPRRPAMLLAVAAGLCWSCALAMLLTLNIGADPDVFATERIIFYVLVLVAGLLSFVPAQRQLRLPGLVFEGVSGTFLLLYALAFVPPPTGSLLSLPDIPVYVILLLALFWSVSAIAMPLVYMLGKRLFRQRARQYDTRRSRRQAHEIGALVALAGGMAGLRVLTPLGFILLILILVVTEMLCLAYIETVK